MEILIAITIAILVGVISFYIILNKRQKGELKALSKEKADLSAKLTKAEQDRRDSETQLNDARTEISGLTEQVDVANRRIANLTIQLNDVSESNENALKLSHVLDLSLQLTAFALYRGVSHATHLSEANKELYEKYKWLHAEYKENFEAYADFREEVERRAKRRLVTTGAGALLSLIPGVGTVQMAADLIELVSFIGEFAEDTVEFHDVLSAVASTVDLINVLEDVIDFRALQSSDEDRERGKEEYQTVFKEVFDQNLGQDLKEFNTLNVDKFLKNIIQRMKDLVESVPENERQNAVRNLVEKFSQFKIVYHTYHESSNMGVDRSLPVPEN